MKELEKMLSGWFAKLPDLPQNVRTVIVKIAPYLAIIGIVVSIPAILILLGLGTIASPFLAVGGAWSAIGGSMLASIYAVASIVLLALALPGLRAKTVSGWNYMYYNALIGAVYAILRFDIVGLVIGSGISLYILFQVRASYR